MVVTDPIADLLTRMRNALIAKHATVECPASRMKKDIIKIIDDEGFIKGYSIIDDGRQGIIKITLKYSDDGNVISGLKRISKPGLRVYARKDEVPKVLNGMGIAILSTSQGVLTDKEARTKGIGGEVLCTIW